jgi:GNAT superfamily N-acetyltransferase
LFWASCAARVLCSGPCLTCQPCLAQFWPRDVPATEKEIDFFLNVDFVSHVALVAVLNEGGRSAIVGGGRYIVLQPGTAEVAFVVIDQRQGQGIGGALMKHLAAIARQVGLRNLLRPPGERPDAQGLVAVLWACGQRACVVHHVHIRAGGVTPRAEEGSKVIPTA